MYSKLEKFVLENFSGRKQIKGKWYQFHPPQGEFTQGKYELINPEKDETKWGSWSFLRDETQLLEFITQPQLFKGKMYLSISLVPESDIEDIISIPLE